MSKKSESFPSVSIVVVNYNGKELLKQCLLTLSKTDYPNYEVVVVDNASTDGSLTEIRNSFGSDPKIKVVENNQNVGHAEGCNIGAKNTQGRYIVFLDSDTEFNARNWLRELVKLMEKDDSVGLAQAKLVLAQNKNCLDYVCVDVDALGTWAANYGSKAENLKDNFEILAVNSGQSKNHVKDIQESYKLTYPLLVDKEAKTATAYGVAGLPSSYFVDKTGKIVKVHVGWAETEDIISIVEALRYTK